MRTLGSGPLVVTLQPETSIEFDSSGLDGPTQLVLRAANGLVVTDRWITWRGRWSHPVLPGAYTVTVRPMVGAPREQPLVVGSDGARCVL